MNNLTEYLTKPQLELLYKFKPGSAQEKEFWRWACKTDMRILAYILGYRDLGQFHDEQLKYLAKDYQLTKIPVENLWLWFRGGFKTSLITVVHTIYLIINNPNIRILIESNTIEISKKMISEIKGHFIGNKEFRALFKEFCPVPSKDGKIEFGTTEWFSVICRTKNLKEPTVMCAGQGTNLTGLHFDRIKADDMVTKDSVSNETQIQASKDHFASFRSLFDNPMIPRIDVTGTTYHFNDLYQDLLKQEFYRKSVIPVRINDVLVFPERHNEEALTKLEEDPTVGPYEFAAQYLMTPLNPKDIKFKPEWLKVYDKLPDGCKEYICVDPASTQNKKSDYTVIERWGVDSKGLHYLIEGVRDRVSAFQRIDILFEMVKRSKNLMWVKYEVLGGRHGDLEVIRQKQQQDKVYFLVRETKNGKAAKADRIEQRLVGQWASGVCLLPNSSVYKSIYDNKAHDFVQEYKLEYLQFPFCEHDDILDCHAQMFEEAVVKGAEVKSPAVKKGMTADEWDKFYKSLEIDRRRYPFTNQEQWNNKLRVQRMRRALAGV